MHTCAHTHIRAPAHLCMPAKHTNSNSESAHTRAHIHAYRHSHTPHKEAAHLGRHSQLCASEHLHSRCLGLRGWCCRRVHLLLFHFLLPLLHHFLHPAVGGIAVETRVQAAGAASRGGEGEAQIRKKRYEAGDVPRTHALTHQGCACESYAEIPRDREFGALRPACKGEREGFGGTRWRRHIKQRKRTSCCCCCCAAAGPSRHSTVPHTTASRACRLQDCCCGVRCLAAPAQKLVTHHQLTTKLCDLNGFNPRPCWRNLAAAFADAHICARCKVAARAA